MPCQAARRSPRSAVVHAVEADRGLYFCGGPTAYNSKGRRLPALLKGYEASMIPAFVGLMIVGAFVLLIATLAWGAATDREALGASRGRGRAGLAGRRRRGGPEMTERLRVCALCGVEVPAEHGDAGCPLIEALGFVMAESERAESEDLREP